MFPKPRFSGALELRGEGGRGSRGGGEGFQGRAPPPCRNSLGGGGGATTRPGKQRRKAKAKAKAKAAACAPVAAPAFVLLLQPPKRVQ